MCWKTTWPTTATVMEAGFATLDTWANQLPAPCNDLQRSVLRKIHKRRAEMARVELRREAPDLASKYDALFDRLQAILKVKP